MTVCIAGVCTHNGADAVVLCSDWQGTYSNNVKTQESYKIRPVGRFRILLSDDETAADELIALLTPILAAYEGAPKSPNDFDIRVSALMAEMRRCTRQRQMAITEHFVGMNYSSSLADFRSHAFQWLGADLHRAAWEKINNLGLECSLIVAFVDDIEPILITIGGDGGVSLHDNYCIIGSGADVALSFLAQIDYFADMSLFDCVVRLFQAKSMAEKTTYVGDRSMISLLVKGIDGILVTDIGWDYLRKQTVAEIIEERKIEFEEGFLGGARNDGSK